MKSRSISREWSLDLRAIRAPKGSALGVNRPYAICANKAKNRRAGARSRRHRTELWKRILFYQNILVWCRGGNLPPANERKELRNKSLSALTPLTRHSERSASGVEESHFCKAHLIHRKRVRVDTEILSSPFGSTKLGVCRRKHIEKGITSLFLGFRPSLSEGGYLFVNAS